MFILLAAAGGLSATLLTSSGPELGLDLQGGVSVVLQPTKQATNDQMDVALEIIRSRVDALGVAEPEIARQGGAIVVQLPGVENRDRVLNLVGDTAELRFRPVLQDLGTLSESGETTTTTAPGETTTTAPGETTTTTAATTTPPSSEGAIGLTEGEFAGVAQEPTTTAPPDTTATTAPVDPNATTTTVPGETPTAESILTPREQDVADQEVILKDKDGKIYQLGPTLATGRVVESAKAVIPQGKWEVALTMHGGAEGIDLFNAAAAKCYQSSDPQVCPTGRLAIVLDSQVESSPSINAPSFDRDKLVIEGSFTEGEAKDLALVLKYGSLPVELKQQDVKSISASLGEDSLRAGIVAGIVGLVLVAIYMILYYRALGVVVLAGLSVWGSLLYSIISWLGATQGLALTLAGVTGIIVSVGITVDSYVVFFERLKDEVKAGRTLRTSSERAFKRAFRTILAADISSFLGAAVLWWLTVGSVRGFAFFLGLSTVLDVVTAWFFTRPVVTYLSRNRLFTEAPFLGVARGLALPVETGIAAAPAGGGR
ncbi:MAG TPA: protein translocase subunit SecD [Acidimicrobiales bacterium]